jgi:hypothetical protein
MNMLKPTVYLETTIISYLAARPSRDLVTAAHQQVTHEWWDTRRARYSLFVSEFVIKEAAGGDEHAAERRLGLLQNIPLLTIADSARCLAHNLTQNGPIPARCAADAFHMAVAAVQEVDFLLTWNCTHIANAGLWRPIRAICNQHGCTLPAICTPVELMEAE